MNPETPPEKLIVRLTALFRNGLVPDADLLHFIDSTFGRPERRELIRILENDREAESETLRELIFFPDDAARRAVEPLLERCDYHAADIDRIARRLAAEVPQTLLAFPEPRGDIPLKLEIREARRYVERLHIDRRLPAAVTDAVDLHVVHDLQIPVKVMFRSAAAVAATNWDRFWGPFFKAFGSRKSALTEGLELLARIWEQADPRRTVFETLTAEKRLYFRQLQRYETFDRTRRGRVAEQTILQGCRFPYLDRQAVRHRMATIDDICIQVFGRTENINARPVEIDLGVRRPGDLNGWL